MDALKRWGFLGLGVVLLLAAGALRLSPWAWLERLQIALAAAGVVALFVALFANAAAVRTWLGGRAARYGFAAVVMVLLALGVAVLANAIAVRHSPRWDLTENKRHSLSPQTIKVLQGLPAPVEVIAFFRTDTASTRRTAEDLLKQYKGFSGGKLTYRIVDPDREPGLAKGYAIEQYGQIVLVRGGKGEAQPEASRAKAGGSGERERAQEARQDKINDFDEEKLTNALVKLMRDTQRIVYVSKGHGEPEIGNTERTGLSQAKDRLEKANYVVKELVLAREGKVPDDAAVLLVPGPRTDPFPPELTAIDAFVARGGKVLFMVNPFATEVLAKHLQKYGVILGDDVVLETNLVSQLSGLGPLVPFVNQYENHPVTRELRGLATLFPLVRSVDVAKTPPPGTTAQVLARTSPQSWGETDRSVFQKGTASPDPNEKRGPLGVAAVATVDPAAKPETAVKPEATAETAAAEGAKKPAKARLAVMGTSMIATNQFIGIEGNPDFFLNLVAWLAEDEDLISIRAKDVKQVPIILTGAQGNAVLWLPVVVLPAVVMLGGVVAAVRRRRSK